MKNLKKLSREDMKTIAGGMAAKWMCCANNGGCSATQTGDDYSICNNIGGTVVIVK